MMMMMMMMIIIIIIKNLRVNAGYVSNMKKLLIT